MLKELKEYPEILANVFKFILDTQEIIRLSSVCKKFHQAAHSVILWEYLIQRDLGQIIVHRPDFLAVQFDKSITPYERYKKIVQQYAYELHSELIFSEKPALFPRIFLKLNSEKQIIGLQKQKNPPITLDDISLKRGLSCLTALQALDATLNKINTDIIKKVRNLATIVSTEEKKIHMTGVLTRIPHEGIFGTLTQIEIQDSSFAGITRLRLGRCLIKHIHLEIFELFQLTHLNLSGNCIRSVPDNISKLTNLTELYLQNNKLTSFPKAITALRTLQDLHIGNLTSEIHRYFTPEQTETYFLAENDEKYILNINRIASIPPEIAQLDQLVNVSLNNLDITELPKEMLALTKLKILNVCQTPLKHLPKALLDRPCLIDCAYTPIWESLFYQCIDNNPYVQSDQTFIQMLNLPPFPPVWQIKSNGARLTIHYEAKLSVIAEKPYRLFALLKKFFH